MVTQVTVTIRNEGAAAPPPFPANTVTHERVDRYTPIKIYCHRCSPEGFLYSLFSKQFIPCPTCRGKKFTLETKRPQSGLAGALAYLRGAGLLSPAISIAFVCSLALGLLPNGVYEAIKALLSLFW